MGDILKKIYDDMGKDLEKESTMAADDPRIRYLVGDYRVVAPNARQKGDRVFLNGSLVVQKKTTNSMKEVGWTDIWTIAKPSERVEGDSSLEEERQKELALWTLLSAGAE